MNHIKKYRLNLFGGVKNDVDILNKFIDENFTKITDEQSQFIMGFNDFVNKFELLVSNDIIEKDKEMIFKQHLQKAAIARSITLGTPLTGLKQEDIKRHYDTYTRLLARKNIIYREPNENLDETHIAGLSEDGCGDKILFTVHFGHTTFPNVETKADAYVIDNNTYGLLKLVLPKKEEILSKFKQPKIDDTKKPKIDDTEKIINIFTSSKLVDKEDIKSLNIEKIDIDVFKANFKKTFKKSDDPNKVLLQKLSLLGKFTTIQSNSDPTNIQHNLKLLEIITFFSSF